MKYTEEVIVAVAMIKAVVSLPMPGAVDVVSRIVTKTVNGGEAIEERIGAAADTYEVVGDAGDVVTLNLQDVDGSGNVSQHSPTLTITLADTFAPPAPGELIVASMEQVN